MRGGNKHLWALPVLVAVCAPAGAQSASLNEGAPWLQVSTRVTYDTNVSRSSAAVAAARGLSQDDVNYAPSAAINLSHMFGPASVYLRGNVGYSFYQTDTILNRETINSEAGVNVAISDCKTSVNGTISRQQSELQDLTLPISENVINTVTTGLSASCQQTVGFSPFLSAQSEWTTESALLLQSSDYNSQHVDGGLTYSHPVIGNISAFGHYQWTDFPKRPILLGGRLTNDSYTVASGGVRYSGKIGSKLDVNLSLSYMALDPVQPTAPKFDGISYEGHINYSPNWRLQLGFGFQQDTKPSTQLNSTFTRGQSLSLNAGYKLSERLSVQINASRQTSTYEGSELISHVNLGKQTVNLISGNIGYVINDHFSASLFVATDKRKADVTGYGYSSTRVGVALTASL